MFQSPLRIPLIEGKKSYQDVSDQILGPLVNKPNKSWYLGITLSFGAMVFGLLMMGWTIWQGIGTWGENRTVGWAFEITTFVWWIGIGHAGTFISAITVLLRQ
jgi:hypothetical protein